MNDLMREQMFAQWLISKILALYMTQDSFREEVNSKVNDGYSVSVNGEKMDEFEQTEWKLNMVCVDIAKQVTEYYFKAFMADEYEADTPQTEGLTHGYMWVCPKCGLDVHSDFATCVRCGEPRPKQTDCPWK